MPGRQLVPYQDDARVLQIPDTEVSAIPVTNITYAQAEVAAGVEGVQASCAIAAATALFDMDLGFEQASLTPGLGPQVSDITLIYAVTGQALTAAPTITLNGITYGPVGAASAAPTVAAVGGTIATTPATLPTAVSTAGQVYTAQLLLGSPYRMNTDLQKLVARLSVPLAAGGSFNLLGAFVHFTQRIAQ